jgi:hypothetical protein
MSAGTILPSSEICDLGPVVGTTFELWFSAAAPLLSLLSLTRKPEFKFGCPHHLYHTHGSNYGAGVSMIDLLQFVLMELSRTASQTVL